MRIGTVETDELTGPYVIAEIGVNYFDIAEKQDISPLKAAKEMVAEAAEAGADAVKFQSYTADRLASKHSPAYWDTDEEETDSQYELFERYDDFGKTEFEELASWTAQNYGIHFLSTPFDFEAVDYLEELVPAYKIASADITNLPLLRRIASKGKPILMSTGASTVGEIDNAIRAIEDETDNVSICLLHCVLEYPTGEANANLGMIKHLEEIYPEYEVGYSDHVPPDDSMMTLINASFQGANVIEKHFTLDKSLPGNDHYHAMDAANLRTFKQNIEHVERTTGQFQKRPIVVESDARREARRSLVAAEDINENTKITRNQIAIKRPGTGISPTMIDTVVGRTAQIDIEADEIISWDLV